MKFSLGKTPSVSTQGTNNQLAGGKIHTVKFDELIADKIEKKDGSATFDVIKIKFSNAEGTFEHTVFEPRPGDEKRQPNNFGYENPSQVEEMMFLLGHLIAAVNPTVSKQIEDKGGIDVDTWEALRTFMVKNTTKVAGKAETQIKLMLDKDGRPRFPGFVLGVSKKGEVYPRTNFIGKDLTFTANELKQIEARQNAAPTQMAAQERVADAIGAITVDDDDDLNLDLV